MKEIMQELMKKLELKNDEPFMLEPDEVDVQSRLFVFIFLDDKLYNIFGDIQLEVLGYLLIGKYKIKKIS